jgi:hypothetical protein
MLAPLFSSPSPLYEHLFAIFEAVAVLICLGHGILGLLRNIRNYRNNL